MRFLFHFSLLTLNRSHFSLNSYFLLSLKSLLQSVSQPIPSKIHLVNDLDSLSFMHFMHLDLRFGVLKFFFWVFEFFCEIYGLGFVNLISYDHALHPHCIITMFHAYLDVCDWLLLLSVVRFRLGDPYDALKFSCHLFMRFSCIRSFLFYSEHVFLSVLSLFLSDRLRHGTQTAQIHSDLEPSSRFRVIFFFYSSSTLSYSVPWWEGQDRLLWELLGPWRSSRTPSHSIEFLRHYATQCHSDSRMGISLWGTCVLSCHVYSGVLLQHTRHR